MTNRLRSIAVVAAVIVLDRLTKLYIQANLGPFDSIPVIPNIFNIVHSENPGAAFGMLADAPSEWRSLVLVGFSVAVMALVAWMLLGPTSTKPSRGNNALPETFLTRTGLALVLGGALGNLWDRIFTGTVTDFLQVFIGSYEFPSFNVADSGITIGAGLLLLDMWLQREK